MRRSGSGRSNACVGARRARLRVPTPRSCCSLGTHYPRHVHSRDAATPYFKTPTHTDPNTLCGGIVSGPWSTPSTSTDRFTDDRNKYEETEAGLDYSGSALCAFGGYAAVANGGFSGCTGVRGPLTGRV